MYNESFILERVNLGDEEIEIMSAKYEESEKKKQKKNRSKKVARFNILLIFVCSAFAGNRAAAVKWKVQSTLSLMDYDDSAVISNVDREALLAGGEVVSSDDIINVLLIGADKRAAWGETTGRSDACMIATIDMKHKKLKLTSLMRDMYVDIPGYGKHNFNAAYSYGGVELLYKTILTNFGITVQGYAVVDFAAFKKVVNALGGVNVKLTDVEYNWLMKNYHRTSVLDLVPGKNKMNGTQALAYCRIRKVDSDFGRTERRRYVLQQIFTKMKSKPISKWYDVAEVALPEITTDLSEDKIIEYMMNVIFMGTTEIEQLNIPLNDAYVESKINGRALNAYATLLHRRTEIV